MTAPAEWILHLTVPRRTRSTFLTIDLEAIVPEIGQAVSFTDLGGELIEVMVSGATRHALGAWLAAAMKAGRVTAAAVSDRALAVDGVRPRDAGERAAYVSALFALSARALQVLHLYVPGPVPSAVVAREVQAVHHDRGDPQASLAWHVRFLTALIDRALTSTSPPSRAADLTARLAHGQWLRLRDGQADHHAEIAVLYPTTRYDVLPTESTS
jgi:hypothetical protein